jgi:hypothetical protein
VTEGTAVIEGGVGLLSVQAGDELATAEGTSPFEPVFDVETSGRSADVRAGLGSHSWGPAENNARLDVTLSRDVAWDLHVSAGVTSYDVDLRDLTIGALSLDAGVSEGTLILGASDESDADEGIPVEIEAGVSALRIRVPEGDSVRIAVSEGLTGIDVRGDWNRAGSDGSRVYESAEFDDSGAYWDIDIQAGIGGITVEYY